MSDDERTELWGLLLADPETLVPSRRAIQPAWFVPALAKIRARTSKNRAAAIEHVRRYGEGCEHGTPAGAEPHPLTGLPLCPLCRAQATR